MLNLFYHAGSGNHGCEAIVRSTNKILNQPMQLFSKCPEEDHTYNLEQLVSITSDTERAIQRGSIDWFLSALQIKIMGSTVYNTNCRRKDFLNQVKAGDICLSIGGDNYCYAGVEQLSNLNLLLKRKGAKTVLWGCSVEPDVLSPEIIQDMQRYDLITVRESLSEEGLQHAGVQDNVLRFADPAFQLDRVDLPLPVGFEDNNTIGINLSPLVISREPKTGLAMKSYCALIEWILKNTTCQIALIPHVVKPENDDRIPLQALYHEYQSTGRLCLIEDHNCMELKGYIARCRFFIGARTHATIAAYSTCVPTLVVGYSVKARGIARDLFGTEDNYVLPVQTMQNENDLTKAFVWLSDREQVIRNHLEAVIPSYKDSSMAAGEAVRRLMK